MMNNMHIITEITPLVVSYKGEKSPVQSIVWMWKIGEILGNYIKKNNIKPHTLFRDLYGKSETSSNYQQKSYIAREFQGRCYRVYKMFKSTEEIQNNFINLRSISVFREAMPFFDNPKYQLDRTTLYNLLNSTKLTNNQILLEVKKLQKEIIAKKNPRTQKLHELKPEIDCFKLFYLYVLDFIKIRNFEHCCQQFIQRSGITSSQIRTIAKHTEQLVLDNIKHSPIDITGSEQILNEYIKMIENLLTPTNIKKLRRFRRVINSKQILLLTDMLYALTDKDAYFNLVRRLR